jgi:hypothetical protein
MRQYLTKMMLAGALGFGCATPQQAGKPSSDSADGAEKLSENIRQRKQGNETVVEYDLNKDKRTDVWSYTVKAKGPDGREFDRLVRKELDLNNDGKVDVNKTYDEKEQVIKESLDLDFDGKVDQTNHYEKGIIVRKESDLASDGKASVWKYYEKGKLVRKERDTNGDGKVDYWEYWEGEQVDRIGEDLDGDGNVDKWTKNPNSEG